MGNEERIETWKQKRLDAASLAKVERLKVAREMSVERADAELQRNREIGDSFLPDASALASGRMALVGRRRKQLRQRGLVLGLGLGLPTLLVLLYGMLWATPLYETESAFAIRTIDGNSASGPVGSFGLGAAAPTTADAFQVREHILSRAMMDEMQRRFGFLDEFAGKRMDPISRLRTIAVFGTDYHDYYAKRVKVAIDVPEGVLKLFVEARSPAQSVRFANALIGLAREQVNRLSRDINADQIAALERDVAAAEAEVQAAAAIKSGVQQQRDELNPQQTAVMVYQVIASLQVQLADAENNRGALLSNGLTESPALPQLQSRMMALRQQINAQRARLVGSGGSLQASTAQFDAAQARTQLAEARLQSAMATLQQARLRALQQTRYFVMIARPVAPLIATTIRGPAAALLALVALVLGYGLISTIIEVRGLRSK